MQNFPNSDSNLHYRTSSETSRRKSPVTNSEPTLFQQESFVSVRSRKPSANKAELPRCDIFRTRSSFSFHILDRFDQHFESASLVDSTETVTNTSEFIEKWTQPVFRLYFLMYLINNGNQSIFVIYF